MTGTDTARPRLLPVLPGVTCLFAALSAMALLSGCSSPPSYREWTASPEVPTVAYDECTEQVDNTMRLRGYPLRPLPETPAIRRSDALPPGRYFPPAKCR